MSSWNGGKSANRGACQAPCRFLYTKNSEDIPESYFSMKDLSLADKINEPLGEGTLYAAQLVCAGFPSSPGKGALNAHKRNENF